MALFDFMKKKIPKIKVEMATHEYKPEELAKQREQEVDKIRILAQKSFPSKNGLRPHEIAMLSSAPRYKTSENIFPQYWYFDYGIDNPQQILDMLLDRGFIRAATAKESAEKLKVSQLKSILSEFEIEAKGRKSDLIAAVRENVSEENLSAKIPVRQFVLTTLGEQELRENEYVSYFDRSRKYGLTVWDMNKLLKDYPKKLFMDKIWANLNQDICQSVELLQRDGDMYAFYCREISMYYSMCDFLIEENKHLMDALKSWARAFYYDIMIKSVAEFKILLDLEKYKDGTTMRRVKDPETGKNVHVEDNTQPQFSEKLNISFKAINVKTIKDYLNFSDNEIFKNLILFFSECSAPRYDLIKNRNITELHLSYEDIAGLVVAEINGNKKISDTIYKSIEEEIIQDKRPI